MNLLKRIALAGKIMVLPAKGLGSHLDHEAYEAGSSEGYDDGYDSGKHDTIGFHKEAFEHVYDWLVRNDLHTKGEDISAPEIVDTLDDHTRRLKQRYDELKAEPVPVTTAGELTILPSRKTSYTDGAGLVYQAISGRQLAVEVEGQRIGFITDSGRGWLYQTSKISWSEYAYGTLEEAGRALVRSMTHVGSA